MNRKTLYGLLAIVLLLPLAYLAMLPSSTRATFFSEFKHNTGMLFGYEPQPVVGADGTSGLRIEHPEEYGPAPSASEDAEENAAEEEGKQTQAETAE